MTGYIDYENLNESLKLEISKPTSADNVTDTNNRVLVTPNQRAQIDANTIDITSHSQRIVNLESTVGNISSTDEKVKLNSIDISGYLEDKLDNTTIRNVNNKMVVKGLDGLTSTINELNLLTGATSNIQAQINALTNVGNFTTSVDTHADLATLSPSADDMVIVIEDDSQPNSPTSIYIYNGTTWIYSGKFEGGQIRDFTTDPLDLVTETTGVLPKSKYEKQNASETLIVDASGNLVATNVEDAIAELFTYADNIKTSWANVVGLSLNKNNTAQEFMNATQDLKALFATYLTRKGVIAYPYNTVEEMINKVSTIPNVTLDGTVKSVSKLNVSAPYQYQITLSAPLRTEDIATTVLKFVGSNTGVVHYKAEYNNNESVNFDFDNDKVVFDGYMRIKDSYEYPLTEVTPDYFESEEVNFGDFVEYGEDLNVDTNSLISTVKGLKCTSIVITANDDISLTGISTLDKINFDGISSGNGSVKVAISFNGGLKYNSWDGSQWVVVDINDIDDFKINGMNANVINTLTNTELRVARGNSNFIRFAYLLEQPTYSDVAKNDKIELSVTTQGYNEIVSNLDFSYSYDIASKTLTYDFYVDGTYTISYVDGN